MSQNESATQTNATAVEVRKMTAHEKYMQLKEAEYMAKYPGLDIVEGSCVQERGHHYFADKIRVRVRCECGTEVERASSDLHTFIGCESCKDVIRKERKAERKAEGGAPRAKAPSQRETELEAEVKAMREQMAKMMELMAAKLS